MKVKMEFDYHKCRHIQDPVKHLETGFGWNIWQKRKISILDAWQGVEYASGRRMKVARYHLLPFVSLFKEGIEFSKKLPYCNWKINNFSPKGH